MASGDDIASLLTWDSKITAYVGSKGGVGEWVKVGLEKEGLYTRFVDVMTREYELAFGTDVSALSSADVPYGIPPIELPVVADMSFPNCNESTPDSSGTLKTLVPIPAVLIVSIFHILRV